MRAVCADFDCQLVEFNGENNHLHLLANYPPKVAIARLVNSIKGVSSRRMRPCCRTTGGCPIEIWRSVALFWMTVDNSLSINGVPAGTSPTPSIRARSPFLESPQVKACRYRALGFAVLHYFPFTGTINHRNEKKMKGRQTNKESAK